MTAREMLVAVETALILDNPNYELENKMLSDEIFYYLTKAEMDYIQDIYSLGVDKNEENKIKLGNLIRNKTISTAPPIQGNYPDSYVVNIGNDVLYILNERARFDQYSNYNILIKPISYDEYSANKDNPFKKPRPDKFWRLKGPGETNNTIIVPSGYALLYGTKLDYIAMPQGISNNTNSELHESTHNNIVTRAVKLILGAKQNQIGYQIQDKEDKENK